MSLNTETPALRPRIRAEAVVWKAVGPGMIVYEFVDGAIMELNSGARLVFEQIDGERDVSAISEIVTRVSGGALDLDDVLDVLGDLADQQIVELTEITADAVVSC